VPQLPDQPVAIEEGSQLGNFANSLIASISRHWHQQRRWANTDLRVRISIRILRSGEFTDIRIVSPSGDTQYDAAALQALTDYPYGPPLPDHIEGSSIEVTVVLVPR
jgi:TonB family protein